MLLLLYFALGYIVFCLAGYGLFHYFIDNEEDK
jgi:hypothetical protein